MTFLFDTHSFIWWHNEPKKLSQSVLEVCQNESNILLLSVVSAWEMQIKIQMGKLKLDQPLADVIETQISTNKIKVLPVTLVHVFALQNLPMYHKDPFDRLLMAQAQVEKAVLMSKDAIFTKYPVPLLW